jgi:hypothetical protein
MAIKSKKLSLKVFTEQRPPLGSYEPALSPVTRPDSFSHPEDAFDLKQYIEDVTDEVLSTGAAAQTAALTDITFTAPGTADYAIQDLVDVDGFGFVTKDEGNTVLSVIKNLQDRVAELEARLAALSIIS